MLLAEHTTVDRSLAPDEIAALAVNALKAEAELTPKPGLVDRRGSGAHADMDLPILLRSADALHEAFAACASTALELPLGLEMRARIGLVGRTGEQRMLAATNGVNTHRGSLWALGLLAAGAARQPGALGAVRFAACLAQLPDIGMVESRAKSHGAHVRRQHGVPGAPGEAAAGFPHVTDHALPALHRARARGADEASAQLDALLAVMAHLPDTCLLHRGGPPGLAVIRRSAARVLAAGGTATAEGRRRLTALDHIARSRRLSPGGSADLLTAALFLDLLPARKEIRNADADL